MELSANCALCNSLGSIDGNFLSNTDEAKRNHARIHIEQSKIFYDGISEDEISRQCFTIRQPKIERSELSKSECRRSLLVLCKSLLKDQSKSAPVVCNICGLGISKKERPYDVINHACAHLEDKLFKCRHCDQSLSSGRTILQHIRHVHDIVATKEDFEDKTVERLDEISSQIKRCFSTNYPRAFGSQRRLAVMSDTRHKSQQALTHFCRLIFIQRSKSARLKCNLCGVWLSLLQCQGFFKASAMYEHASTHLDIKLFACRHCSHSTSSKAAAMRHLKDCHRIIDGTIDDFDDQSETFHSEHLNMIERCFSAEQVKLETPSPEEKDGIMVKAAVRRHASGSKIYMERLLFCNRLTRKMAGPDGRIKCALCSKRLAVMFSGCIKSKPAFFHVEMHLQKPLYRCKVCKSPFNTRPAVVHHLKKKHALGMGKNVECVADEFHVEIMAMLSKCYGTAEGL